MVSSTTNLSAGGAVDCDVFKSIIGDLNKANDDKGNAKNNGRTLRKKAELTKGKPLRQVTAAFIANLGTINTGMTMGFSAVAIPQLVSPESTFRIMSEQASWVASLSSVGTLCGCMLSAYLTDILGRRRTLIVTELPAIAGWIIIAIAPSTEWIYLGRILTGVSSGMIGAPSRVYTAEVSQPHLRGVLLALASLGASIGVALEYWVGSVCDWKTLAWISSVIPMFSLCMSFFLPESPSWLVSSGQKHKCFNSLKKLRGSTCDVQREVNTLVEFSERNNNYTAKMTIKQKLRNLCQAAVLKPFLILTMYFFIYQMSGSNPLQFYIVNIFEDFGADQHQKYVFTAVVGGVRLLFTICGCMLMLRVRRRTLTFVSSIGCGLSMLALGSYGFLIQYYNLQPQLSSLWIWVPVSSIFIFIILSTVGYLIVPWVMIGELYPAKVRGLVGGLTTASCHFFIFVAVKTYPILRDCTTKNGPFLLYGMISLFGTIFLYVFLPETKDKSLQEIEEHFTNAKNKNTSLLKEKKPIVVIKA